MGVTYPGEAEELPLPYPGTETDAGVDIVAGEDIWGVLMLGCSSLLYYEKGERGSGVGNCFT